MKPKKIIHVVGARPNFMKIAPIIEAIRAHNEKTQNPMESIHQLLVHTGQHYDAQMSKLFFDELMIPKPDVNLEVKSSSHARQAAEIMIRFEEVCLKEKPTHVLVVGDVNSTIACALVASKLGIKVIHVEAGLRSFDRSMPEEINRILTDSISDYLFITEASAEQNLVHEGVARDKIFFVGNVMIDSLLKHRDKAEKSTILQRFGLTVPNGSDDKIADYCLVTLHRPSNVDDPKTFQGILAALSEIARDMPIIFPAHPRTIKQIRNFGFEGYFNWEMFDDLRPEYKPGKAINIHPPLGYLDFLRLMDKAGLVMTDSGGIQEETTILGTKCVTLRENTERPITLEQGTNVLAGTDKGKILDAARSQLRENLEYATPPLWDGRAAERIVAILAEEN
jgi:UDP-N-acetylglucosamine 2-epimerase (non-hydrolysing)